MATVIIRPRARVFHGHDWVHDNEVLKVTGKPEDGLVAPPLSRAADLEGVVGVLGHAVREVLLETEVEPGRHEPGSKQPPLERADKRRRPARRVAQHREQEADEIRAEGRRHRGPDGIGRHGGRGGTRIGHGSPGGAVAEGVVSVLPGPGRCQRSFSRSARAASPDALTRPDEGDSFAGDGSAPRVSRHTGD